MSKKSLNRKIAKQFIIDSRDNGKSDQDIYNELSKQYYDKKAIVMLITGTVRKELKEKYRLYNYILLGFICVTILFKITAVLALTLQTEQLLTLLLLFIVPLLNIYFFYQIKRFNGPMYRFLGILAIIEFFQSVGNSDSLTESVINLLLAGSITLLAFYLALEMFPNYGQKKLKKDSNGEYILKELETEDTANIFTAR